jgi:hypothetical protein
MSFVGSQLYLNIIPNTNGSLSILLLHYDAVDPLGMIFVVLLACNLHG